MSLSLALLVPWAAGTLLIALDGRRRYVAWSAVAALVATLVAIVFLTFDALSPGPEQVTTGGWQAGVGIVLRADALGVAFALVSVLVLIFAVASEAIVGVHSRTFPGLVVLLAAGLTGLFLTADVFNFYVFFEISMIASYALTTYGGLVRQLRAALIFAAVNLLGSFVFLISVAGTYHITGALAMSDVAQRIHDAGPNATLLVAVGFFVAFSVKLGLFPFHFWLPTVYTGTRPAVAAILSGAVANIGSYGLLRFGAGLFPDELRLAATAIIVLGVASMLYGGVVAVSRGDVVETLAYSAIGQVGYMLIALGIGGSIGLATAVVYSIINAVNKGVLFLAAGLRGPLVAAAFAIGAFSVAGVPPAAGFIAKLEVFRTAVAAGNPVLLVLLVVGSVLSLVYMFQVYQRRFWRPADPSAAVVEVSALPARALVLGFAVLVLAAGLAAEPLLSLCQDGADVLLRRL
ncbi:oxidoreductase [Mycobacterium intermedium]|uniref:complex I subunit 5 family protein n=1 Tax=Mycobacterium intermedium TaxID=28445 RepID=UPI00084957C8|nr:proton-conducting transporter membrane subunit [Mycobacterium intermedium]MCV6967439.1 oxidoreductase [Mycobacterium intermedium]ODQ99340.1 oxidoreductase [Mycobacterium intermedium]OPE50007.1 oxidoreductase [Mycobacterium intermedium]